MFPMDLNHYPLHQTKYLFISLPLFPLISSWNGTSQFLDSSLSTSSDTILAHLLLLLSTKYDCIYMIGRVVLLTILPNSMNIFQAVLNSIIPVFLELGLHSGEVHRICDDRGIVQNSKFYAINRLSKRTTLFVFEEFADHHIQSGSFTIVDLGSCYKNALMHYLQLLKPDFISLKMRNIPSESTKFTNEIDGRAMNGRRASNDKPERYDQKQLYQLCQQLSRQNRHLKRQVNDLRKLVASNEDNNSSMFFQQNQKQNYREINYECYKKKAIQILTSLKLLQNLYTERTAIDKKNRILESFMGKIKHGNLNHIDELLKLYGECLQGKEEDSWNIDQLQRQCSQYQNSILRRHIQKLSTTLFQSVKALKNNLQQVKLDIIENQEKIQQEIKYYCGKYVVDNLKVSGQPKQTKKIKKKKSKASNDQNAFEKVSWDKIVDQRSKIKQKQKLQPNVKQKIHQSLLIAESKTFGIATPLSNQQPSKPKIPKPQSKCNKQQITIIDQLQNSKYVGNSTSTPQSIDKSRNNAKNHSRNSISKHGYPSNEKSLNQSPRRKYSYFR